ncbi:alanine racemase [Cohnella thailandensis]|uniref:Alanine racemase n=1 Tax=Cohnella thailandensis TaxID=557557 RepID=A0A841SNH5_9BACL|nr:alanine racemase [Cohnella thailandensis]MBB6633494.1 alanine racemase [Cohnella thailandensis]MBP1974511.1 alanine racemase [Cohnella thailandensis]
MDSYYRPTIAEISLDALEHNVRAFRRRLANGTKLLASVKANAYGHGAVESAKAAVSVGADYLGVAFLDEALQLRQGGVDAPILVLGYTPAEAFGLARRQGITLTLYRHDQLDAVERLTEQGPRLKAHVKIDSGMGRLGVLPGPEAERFLERACSLPQLDVEGMFTHYAKADETDKTHALMQAERFHGVAEYVRKRGLPISIVHAGNSAAGIDLPDRIGQMLRLGIGMYGLYPSDEVRKDEIELKPVLSLKTKLVHVKTVPPGEGISYGARYVTSRTERVGTIPVGYADGFSRMLTGKAEALLRGRRVPVLGTICMDQCMIGLDAAAATGEPEFEPGEEVVLIGRQGDQVLTAEEVAAKLGTINYEVTCMVASRVPRVFLRDGVAVSVRNPIVSG